MLATRKMPGQRKRKHLESGGKTAALQGNRQEPCQVVSLLSFLDLKGEQLNNEERMSVSAGRRKTHVP